MFITIYLIFTFTRMLRNYFFSIPYFYISTFMLLYNILYYVLFRLSLSLIKFTKDVFYNFSILV